MASQLALQRIEYEGQVKRQLEFVDQLVDDKAALSVKCEELAGELQLVHRRFVEQVKGLEDAHAKDLKKQVRPRSLSLAHNVAPIRVRTPVPSTSLS